MTAYVANILQANSWMQEYAELVVIRGSQLTLPLKDTSPEYLKFIQQGVIIHVIIPGPLQEDALSPQDAQRARCCPCLRQ